MLNFADLTQDPDFSQSFEILRSSGIFIKGVWQAYTLTSIPAIGIIYPTTAKEIVHVPEGDRVTGMITFITNQELFITHTKQVEGFQGLSDNIKWHNDSYELASVMDWGDFGFYLAVGARLSGS